MKRLTALILGAFAALIPAMALAQEELPSPPEVPTQPVSSSVLDGVLAMSTESMIMLVAGVVLSLVSSILLKQTWSDDIKAGIFFLVCLAFGVVYTLTLDEWSTTDMGRRVLLVLVSGTLFYQLFKGPMQTFTTRSDVALNRTP